jgi:hypothetical protein
MIDVSFYDSRTGIFDRRILSLSNESLIAKNTPADHIAVMGRYDRSSHVVNLSTGEIESIPVRSETAATDRRILKARIKRLELSQLRPERELRLDPTNESARQRLAEIEAKIVELRQNIRHG